MMDKVYCKNCKWFSIYRSCNHLDYERPRSSGRGKEHAKADGLPFTKKTTYFQILGDYDKYNKDNNCPYYQREWWKFWLKKK